MGFSLGVTELLILVGILAAVFLIVILSSSRKK